MGIFMIFLALGLVGCDKLDGKYLPPPGAHYAGGNPEDLQVPLELLKETTEIPFLTPVAPDNNLLRSDYFIGSAIGSNVGKDIDTTSNLKSLKKIPSNTLPTTPFTYMPKTISGFDYETTNRPLDVSQNRVNIEDQTSNKNLGKSLPRLKSFTSLKSSQDSVSNNHAIYIQSCEPKHEKQSELRKYQGQNGEALASEITNAQKGDNYRYNQNNPLVNDEETASKSANFPGYTMKNFMPAINNYLSNIDILPSRYGANTKIIDYIKFQNNPGQNNTDSLTTVSNFKYNPRNTDTRSDNSYKKKPRPLSSRINNRIISNKTRYQSERPQAESDRNAIILNYQNVITPKGFLYSYDTSSGISARVSGTADNGVRAQGAFSYTGDDGKVYKVVYTADENGFQPHGEHLPPLPTAIQRFAEKAAREKEVGITDDGSYDEDKYGHKKYHGAMERYHPDFQGFSVNRVNQLRFYPRKTIKDDNTNRSIEITKKEFYKNKKAVYQVEDNDSIPNNRVTGFAIQGEENNKLLDNSDTKSISKQKNIGEIINSKAKLISINAPQNIVKEEKTLSAFPIQQGERKQSLSKAFDLLPLDYTTKKALVSNNNIPEIIANSNTYTKMAQGLNDEQDGYFYIKPLNKFNENANQEKVKFDSDQELEIGDDDIITISVPVPSISPVYKSSKTISPYNQQYTTVNGVISKSDVNIEQEANHVFSILPNNTVDSTTPLSEDIYNEGKRPCPDSDSKAEFKTIVKPTGDGPTNTEYAKISQQPQMQTLYDLNADPNMLRLGFETVIDDNIYDNLTPGFNSENHNKVFPGFEKSLGIYKYGSLEVNDDSVTNIGDIRSDNPNLLKEDFKGPLRPQTFDPETGYYY